LEKEEEPAYHSTISDTLKIKFLSTDCLSTFKEVSEIQKIYVQLSIYHGNKILENKRKFQTQSISLGEGFRARWESELIDTQMKYSDFSRESRFGLFSFFFFKFSFFFLFFFLFIFLFLFLISFFLAFILYAKTREEEPRPIAWVNCQFSDFKDKCLNGIEHLKMWPYQNISNFGLFVGASSQNREIDAIELSFWFFILFYFILFYFILFYFIYLFIYLFIYFPSKNKKIY